MTDEEAATLSGDGKARRRYRKAAKGAERGRRRVRLVAAHDLAEELARAGGADSDRVLFARQEVARLRAP